jgi:hypothetical protein
MLERPVRRNKNALVVFMLYMKNK